MLEVTVPNSQDTFSRQDIRTDVGYRLVGAAMRPLRRPPGAAQPIHALCAVQLA
jgi:hypothetical protein